VGSFRNARASVHEAWRDFRWVEYRPFAWMMLAELLFLFLACNLAAPWGMAGAAWVLRTLGEPGVHYPTSFLFLSSAYARLESLVIAVAGSFLIPLTIARIQANATGPDTVRRARRAYAVTLVGYLINLAVLVAWEFALQAGPRHWISSLVGGFKAEALTWLVGLFGAFAVAILFLYVPIRAVEDDATFGDALGGGVKEGFRSFGPTLLILLVFAWPTLIVLAPLQIRPALVVARFRPELVGGLLAMAAVVNSFVNYFIYSAASRLHWQTRGRES
jgi:hypothetical protein